MKKSLIAALVVTLVLTWSYTALTQRQAAGEATRSENREVQSTETDDLAKRIIIQQQESRENLRRLAEGQIKSFEIINTDPGQKQVFIRTIFSDGTTLDGRIDMETSAGKLYVMRAANITNQSLSDQQVATLSNEDLALGNEIVKSQGEEQDCQTQLLNGDYTKITIDSLSAGQNSTVINATGTLKNGTTKPIKINMTLLNGFWYIKSLTD